MALRDTQGRCKPSTNCFKTRIHRPNVRMEADYENTYDSPRQEQFSDTRYSVRWPRFFNFSAIAHSDKQVFRKISTIVFSNALVETLLIKLGDSALTLEGIREGEGQIDPPSSFFLDQLPKALVQLFFVRYQLLHLLTLIR